MSDVAPFSVVQMLEVAPCFLVADLVASAEHYRDKLGFEVGPIEGDPPSSTTVSRDGIALVLQQADPVPPRVAAEAPEVVGAYIWVTDADELADELAGRGADPVSDGREVRVHDLDGRTLCFRELAD